MDKKGGPENGIFLNGKAQIIEMLQFMTDQEKEILIKNIKMRNPHLATELTEKSLSYSHLSHLNDLDLKTLIGYMLPEILGISLKDADRDFQKRVLTLLSREEAEMAYKAMRMPLKNEVDGIKRAKNKVLNQLVSLCRRKQIVLS